MDLPEIALANVLARFPLKSIANFRLVSKDWKSLLDSNFFRHHYVTFNSSSSSVSWSIIPMKPHKLSLEIISHHGCNTWGLNRSPGSFVSFFAETTIKKLLVLSCTDGLVLVLAEAVTGFPMYYIGNPLTKEWFQIPLPPSLTWHDLDSLRKRELFNDTGLVTKMENGIVVSYRIVWIVRPNLSSDKQDFFIYLSETGTWKIQNVRCNWFHGGKSIALNRILHWLSHDARTFESRSIATYDFYGNGPRPSECCFIHFPGKDEVKRFRRTFTTSEGYIVYFNEFQDNVETWTLRVWRLVKYVNDSSKAWQLSWEINLVSFMELGNGYFPVVMHPLNYEIIYLWNKEEEGLILFNLRTRKSSFHKESACEESKCMDGSVLSFNRCGQYMKDIYGYYRQMYHANPTHLFFSQYVLPRWLHRLPLPHLD